MPTMNGNTEATQLILEPDISSGKLGIVYVIAPTYPQIEIHDIYSPETVAEKHVHREHAGSSRYPENTSPQLRVIKAFSSFIDI